ncbi:unnamed protein product [Phytophthora lilii]|uniref:Unnamed protein product n=1 Tax=Phytophthora lilii TaxID=2077276 RepID=A0A9W6X3G5_9STRA|nr:unnamed protein product [Phytophthora lilii]
MDDKYNGGQTVLNEHETGEGMMHMRADGAEVLPGMADGGSSLRSSAINAANFQTFNKSANDNRGNGGRRPPPESYTCNRCGTKGHWIEDCPTKDQHNPSGQMQRKIPPEGYLCKRCNVPGHYISDCTEPKVPPPSYTCHKCRQKGHWKQDCPMDGNGTISALLNQIRPGGVSVNTGAPSSGGPTPPHSARGYGPRGMMPPPPPAAGAPGLLVPPPPPPHILAGMKRAREDDGRGGGGMPPSPMNGWPPMAPGRAPPGPPGGGVPPPGLLSMPGQPDLKKPSRDPRRR